MMQQLCGSMQICCINSRPYQAVQALQAHKSQYVWYDDEKLLSFVLACSICKLALWLLCVQVSAMVY